MIVTVLVSILMGFTVLALLAVFCLCVTLSIEREVKQTHTAVLTNRKHITELSSQLHKMRERQLIDSKKISLINEFCIEYSYRLVHFSDDELMDMAREESERRFNLEDDSFDTQP